MSNPFDGVRAVLFDMDGTLVETDIDFVLMKQEMLALANRFGVMDTKLEGMDILLIVDEIVARLEAESRLHDAQRAKDEALKTLEMIEMFHAQTARPMPGAAELLEALKYQGIKTGIITRNCRSVAEISLTKTKLSTDVLLTRDDVVNTKPHPDHIRHALALLDVRPYEAVMVGDHWMDVMGGRAAGTRTVGLLHPTRPADFFEREKPDVVIHSLAELVKLMKLKKLG